MLEDRGSASHQQRWDEKKTNKEETLKSAQEWLGRGEQYASRFEAFRSVLGADPLKVPVDIAVNIMSR